MSRDPSSIKGTKKFPNLPIINGITVAMEIIINACLLLNIWSLLINDLQVSSSNRMIIFIDELNIPAQNEKIKYS